MIKFQVDQKEEAEVGPSLPPLNRRSRRSVQEFEHISKKDRSEIEDPNRANSNLARHKDAIEHSETEKKIL